MRILVFFDLPVKTRDQRRAATRFRNFLLGDGYHMVQYSVYARVCSGMDAVAVHKKRLALAVPRRGAGRVVGITEKQYTHLDILLGEPTPYDAPQQDKDLVVF